MEKSLQQTVEERRAYVKRIRASFDPSESSGSNGYDSRYGMSEEDRTTEATPNTLGIRTLIAILIFAAFVYCDKERLTFQDYSTKEVFSQIEWNPLPVEKIGEYIPVP